MSKKIKFTTEEFIKKAKEIHGNKYDYSIILYDGMFEKIKIKCNTCNIIFEQNPTNHIHNKRGCPDCGKKKRQISNTYTTEEFINKVSILPKHKKCNYDKTIFVNVKEKVIITCTKEGHGDFSQTPDHHLSGSGCPKCAVEERANKQRSSINEIVILFKKMYENNYDYSLITEYNNNKTKLPIKCNSCNYVFLKVAVDHLVNKQGCPICSNHESKGEKLVRCFLTDNTINFIKQKRFDECRFKNTLPFDFYLPEHNICIEYDGIQHFEAIEYFGGIVALEEAQKNDNIKNNYCEENNIKLIRIKYTDNVEEKLLNSLESVL